MDSDRFSSVLVKSNSENKTYILVKLSESFSSAIQEYSSSQSADINNLNPICTNNNTSNNSSSYLQPNSNNHHNNLHHNHHKQNNNNHHTNHNNHLHHLNDTNSNITHNHTNHYNNITTNNNHKKAKLHHNAYQQQKRTPTIKFHGTRGTIRFPSGKSYDFSLEQSDNSVECIKQVKNRWNSVGKMACCLHVKGKDDVYQRTRRKMEAAEQEKRKYCAKLLDSGNSETIPTTATTTIAPAATAPTIPTTTPAPSSATTTTTTTTLASNSSSSCSSNSTTTKNNNISSNNLSKYPDITDVKQLKRYKADFDKDYKEYQSLHVYLQGIEERFRKLRELLKKSSEGSPEWEMAKEQIFSEYNLVKSDSNFHRARSKYKQLYQKLAYIKDKIFQFKSKQREKLHKNNNTKGGTSGNINNLHNNNSSNNNNYNHNINNNKFY